MLSIAELARNVNDEELPRNISSQEVFQLLSSFQQAFQDSPEFKNALTEHYFGKLGHGKFIADSQDREVTFFKRGVSWTVKQTFFENNQMLRISIQSAVDNPFNNIDVILETKRDLELDSEPPAMVQVIGLGEYSGPFISKNTSTAVALANQLLTLFKS